METVVLLRFNKYYLVLSEDQQRPTLVHESRVSKIPDGRTVPALELKNILNLEIKEQLFAYRTDKYLVLGPSKDFDSSGFLGLGKPSIQPLINKAEAIIGTWNAERKDTLLRGLFEKKTDLKACIAAFAQYTYCDSYSLWIYNPYSNIFTCAVSVENYTKTFLTESDNSTLFASLNAPVDYELRPPKSALFLNPALNGMKTLNRVRIRFGATNVTGILNLYSKFEHFEIPNENIALIQNILETKYIESRVESQPGLDLIERYFIQNYKSGHLKEFLYGAVEQICNQLSFEACSVFLKDRHSNTLVLEATCDSEENGKPARKIVYDLKTKSLTAQVFDSGEMRFSYDLPNDPNNSNTYGEKTKHEGLNWIGVPLKLQDNVQGVLRVKNRYHKTSNGQEVRNIRSIDIANVVSVGTLLSGIIQLEEIYMNVDSERQRSLRKLQDLNDFNNLFLHEIRTPISTFGLTPILIKKLISQRSSQGLMKATKKLDDIKTMGERLKFITNTYFIDQLISKNEVESLSVLRDIVFPILNITREYYRRVYDLEIRFDPHSLEAQHVFADRALLNIVFNALIDNAAKYSYPSKRPIAVSGKIDDSGKFFHLLVGNYGMQIQPDEADRIFMKGERGVLAKKMKFQGTGTGLYLGKEIMLRQKGDLVLVSMREPVTFAIILPKTQL